MPQVLDFLQVRINLFFRAIRQAGVGLVVFALVLTAGLSVPFVSRILNSPLPIWGLALALPAFLTHFYRRDGRFLHQIGLKIRPALGLEYLLISLPGILLLVFSQNWKGLSALLACVLATPFLPLSNRKTSDKTANFSLNWLPDWAFEWKAGIRQTGIGFWVSWFAGLGISWWVGGLPLFAFLFGTLLVSFFEFLEPKEVLQREFSKKNAFWLKMGRNVAISSLFILPHALVFLVFNFRFWYFLPAIFAFVALTTAFALATKYAAWHPGRRRVAQSLPTGIFIMMAVSAIFTPVALGWLVLKILKARKNLRHFAA